jgi:hypothetical protein
VIELSEVFNLVGTNGCYDVATSMMMQGCEPEVSIPIYEIFYLSIKMGESSSFLAGSISEFNAIRILAEKCGAVAATINLLDTDILTLLGCIMVATPNTGMHVFIKTGEIISDLIDPDTLNQLAELAGIEIPSGYSASAEALGKIIDFLFDRLMSILQDDLDNYGIYLHQFDELPQYFNTVRNSGEMEQMYRTRQMLGGAIL